VTERGIIADPPRASAPLPRPRHVGVSIALDDFGAGQASLAFLARLPLDQIKIDRSFVTDLATNAGNDAIVRSIISLGVPPDACAPGGRPRTWLAAEGVVYSPPSQVSSNE
jgi:EAL domain-containing protein (putative c-di-GMP-specific phosphodiesterase class I)